MMCVKQCVLQMQFYLAGPEDDPIIILWSLLPLLQFLSPNANCHWAQVLINTKVVLVLFKEKRMRRDQHYTGRDALRHTYLSLQYTFV